jgi:hypothetical protein
MNKRADVRSFRCVRHRYNYCYTIDYAQHYMLEPLGAATYAALMTLGSSEKSSLSAAGTTW